MPLITFQLYNPARDKRIIKAIWYLILILTITAFWCFLWLYIIDLDDYDDYDSTRSDDPLGLYEEEADTDAQNCNVFGIKLRGDLLPYFITSTKDAETADDMPTDHSSADFIVFSIEDMDKDENAKAIIIDIDSFGGTPSAGEQVANALKRAKKPTVAVIRDAGISASYYAATGADIIFASKYSDIGSIGVTVSYLDNVEKNQKEGLNYNPLFTGEFKETFNPDKTLTTKERNLIERDLNIIHENFIKAVAENRNLDVEKVRKLADGSIMLGEMALEHGLIDKIGGMYEATQYLAELIREDVELCW